MFELFKRKWLVGPIDYHYRIPFIGETLGYWIPQPRFLRRWYYRKSFDWWDHPSNHHWKMNTMGTYVNLQAGERDLWSGSYNPGNNEERGNDW